MYKLKLTLMSLALLTMTMIVGGSLASMQDRSNDSQQTNQNNSNQNRNSNRSSNRNSNSNRNGNMNSQMMNSNSGMMMNSNSEMMNSGSGMMNSSMGSMSGNANALDNDFAMTAAMGGQAEIQMGQLAVQRSTNKQVKKYAQRMIKDHTKNSRDLQKVAARKQMTLPANLSADQMQMLNQLQQASAGDFDRMYIETAGVMAHTMMRQLYSNQISNGMDADLKKYASKTLPVVEMHLQMAQQMNAGGMMNNNGSMNMNTNSMDMNRNSNMNSNSNMNRNTNSKRNRNDNSNRNMNSNGNSNGNMNSNSNR
jgi:putative membrane protein